ncbi:MAG: peptidase MA family metallohydrolase [Pirellulales bacterium]
MRKQLLAGQYDDAATAAQAAIDDGQPDADYPLLLIEARLAVGQQEEALEALESALDEHPGSIRLRVLAHDLFRRRGDRERARAMLEQIDERVNEQPWSYTDATNLVALGQAALRMGGEPRRVLEALYDRAKQLNPRLRETYLAVGELALDKQDGQVAAKAFREGLAKNPDDPELHYGLARAFAESDWEQTAAEIMKTLEANPKHVPALLMLVDNQLDGEQYPAARAGLEKVLAINPACPEAWAYQAVLDHLEAKPEDEEEHRAKAVEFWKGDAGPEHLIGKKLSRHYRFREAAAYQYAAIARDPTFMPAKSQLAQDLLRLGQEAEGWRLAQEVSKVDGYDVLAYNLNTLHDSLAKFTTLENEHFLLRMDAREAKLYGDRALDLLTRARATLGEKYGFQLDEKVTVEIFPQQKDFAIRTFGLPGGAGFLGVCFGRVITANSPAAQGPSLTSWESVLWHEFCHVVTLELTGNRLPRWLSEGISVYEENLTGKGWGQRMSPDYRQRFLSGKFTPLGQLSSAFLAPGSGADLQFAYFESALAVEYLVEKHGLERLKRVLLGLGAGQSVNEALEQHVGQINRLEEDFAKFARERAEQLAPGLDFTEPPGEAEERPAPERWLADHPNSYWALAALAAKHVRAERWDDARPLATKLIELYPDCHDGENAYALLAAIERGAKNRAAERDVLRRWAERDASAPECYLRLMAIAAEDQDWPLVSQTAQRMLAVNPLVAEPWRQLAAAAEAGGDGASAIGAYQKTLLFDPADPAEVNYRLAALLHAQASKGDVADQAQLEQARRHVLTALAEAPRYRAALRLLRKLQPAAQPSSDAPPATPAAAPTDASPTAAATLPPAATSEPTPTAPSPTPAPAAPAPPPADSNPPAQPTEGPPA